MSEEIKKPRKVFPFEMTIELRNTITLGKGDDATSYTEIPLHEPNVDEIGRFVKKNQKDGGIESMKFMISLISGMPLPVIDKIGAMDYYKAQEYLLYFLTPPEEDDVEGNAEGSQ
jgi:hypothetical protein